MLYKCKKDDLEFILYDNEEHTVEELQKEFGIEADIQPVENPDKSLLFVSLGELLLANMGYFKRTAVSKLGFNSFNELEREYNLIQQKQSKLSRQKRELTIRKYNEITTVINV